MAAADSYTERSGKFRHIFGEPLKKVSYEDLKSPQTSGEGMYMAANRKFIAYASSGGGGPLFVLNIDKPGRGFSSAPGISTHKGKIWDFQFHPFINNMIASGADDCSAHLTMFPTEGVTEDISEATSEFKGHTKKVTQVEFSNVASVMATGSFDTTVKVWNIETSSQVAEMSTGGGIYSVQWNRDSTLLGATSKDKKIYTMDPRAPDGVTSWDGLEGSKSCKMTFLSRMNWVVATGFDKTAKRQMAIWDLRDTSKPIVKNRLDSASSVLVPHWDDDLGVLYTVGKGEGTITYYEIINDATKVYSLSMYRNPTPQKGGAWLPKASCDVWGCEVQRFYKLTKNSIIPIKFTVPRKAGADIFQEDIYPDCFAHKPALTVDAYLGGENAQPLTMTMDPAKRTDTDDDEVVFKKKRTYAELEADLETLRGKYKSLKERLAAADSSYTPSDDDEKTEE